MNVFGRTTQLGAALVASCLLVGCASDVGGETETVGTSADAIRICASGTTLRGIDVSKYQGTVSWTKVKAAGRVFAFARVSDGISHPDALFATNWTKMRSAGVYRGAYQFFRPQRDPVAQATLFVDKIRAAGGMKSGDLPPVLDLESTGGLASSTVIARSKTWLSFVESKLGIRPLVYTANNMSGVIGSSLRAYPLWVANYGVSCPSVPSGWSSWKFWQTSQTGSVSGVNGAVDTNLFNGGLAALQGMTQTLASDDPEPEPVDETVVPPTAEDGSDGATMGHPTDDDGLGEAFVE